MAEIQERVCVGGGGGGGGGSQSPLWYEIHIFLDASLFINLV